LEQPPVLNIPKPVLGIDKVIAGVQASIGLQCKCPSASFGKDAQRCLHPEPLGKSTLKEKDKDFANILPVPDIENTVEKTSVGSSRVDLQACKLEYSIVSPK